MFVQVMANADASVLGRLVVAGSIVVMVALRLRWERSNAGSRVIVRQDDGLRSSPRYSNVRQGKWVTRELRLVQSHLNRGQSTSGGNGRPGWGAARIYFRGWIYLYRWWVGYREIHVSSNGCPLQVHRSYKWELLTQLPVFFAGPGKVSLWIADAWPLKARNKEAVTSFHE